MSNNLTKSTLSNAPHDLNIENLDKHLEKVKNNTEPPNLTNISQSDPTRTDSLEKVKFELLLLGTGPSTPLPKIGCITSSRGPFCEPCKATLEKHNPEAMKNQRMNTGAVLKIFHGQASEFLTLLIDVRV